MGIVAATAGRQAAAAPARVMVVDDSAVVRGFVTRWISAAPGLDLVGTAADGQAGLDKLDLLRPDIVILDLDMPGLGGLEVLPQMLARRPGLSVVVMSALTQRDTAVSMRCLALGAADYIPKPGSRGAAAMLERSYGDDLVAKLVALAESRRRRTGAAVSAYVPAATPAAAPGRPRAPGFAPAKVVAVGASTGGPRALIDFLSGMGPGSAAVPILVVQHLPAVFTEALAGLVRAETGLDAVEAKAGECLRRGRVYIAPGGRHMGLALDGRGNVLVRLDDGAPVNQCRPAVDILFRDVARVFGAGAAAVVLTGMGTDGTEGARAVADQGGTVLVQDEASSVVWGMPGQIAKAGLAHDVLPPAALGAAAAALAGGRR